MHTWGDELNGAAALILGGFADLLEITSAVCAVNAGCAVVGDANAHFAGGAVIEGFAASVVCIVKDAGFAVIAEVAVEVWYGDPHIIFSPMGGVGASHKPREGGYPITINTLMDGLTIN